MTTKPLRFFFLFLLFLSITAPVQGVFAAVPQVAAGDNISFALKTDGTLWAWGRNGLGELGDGSTVQKESPVQIGQANDWATVSAGSFHTAALKSDGSLWVWGFGAYGQLGLGINEEGVPPTFKLSPQRVGSDSDWLIIAAGGFHTAALKSDGTLWTWGANNAGQLGDGSTLQKNSPSQIGAANDWVMISAGHSHTVALKTDGTLWAWGANWNGQLGDGSTVDKYSPVQIGIDNNWTMVSTGYAHTIALKSDGTLWAWGANDKGQLGDSSLVQRTSPVKIGTASNWDYIAAGSFHNAALKSDNTLWAWGYNQYGQLGNNSTTLRTSPVKIGTASNWDYIAAGSFHTIALKIDETQWAWGYNKYGQLGNCTTTESRIPTAVEWGICPDDTPPTGTIVINDNAVETNTVSVILTITCNDSESGCSEMCISNTTNCIIWESLAATKQWILADSDGSKTVYVKLKDNAGNASGNFTDAIILRRPDITVSSIGAPISSYPGASISISDITKNSGTVIAAESRTNIYLSSDSILDAGDALLGGRNVPSLAAGASSLATTSVTLPAEINSGTYYLIVKSDALDSIEEKSETNNIRTKTIAIGADLVISSLKVPVTAASGTSISISDTTKNNGPAQAIDSLTQFYLSSDKTLDAGDALLGGRNVPSLAAGASSLATTSVTLPAEINSGTYYLIAKSDALESIGEINENNNLRLATIKIGPDLVISSLSAPYSAFENTTISVIDTTKNNGIAHTGTSVTKFYLSANTILDEGDTLLGSRNVPSLSGSETSKATTPLILPSVEPGLYYYIIAKADANDEVSEYAESNNIRIWRIFIKLP